jgi:hypothetical protein
MIQSALCILQVSGGVYYSEEGHGPVAFTMVNTLFFNYYYSRLRGGVHILEDGGFPPYIP